MRFRLEITVLGSGKYLEFLIMKIRILSMKEKSEFFFVIPFPVHSDVSTSRLLEAWPARTTGDELSKPIHVYSS